MMAEVEWEQGFFIPFSGGWDESEGRGMDNNEVLFLLF